MAVYKILFSFSGRINRLVFWIISFTSIVISLVFCGFISETIGKMDFGVVDLSFLDLERDGSHPIAFSLWYYLSLIISMLFGCNLLNADLSQVAVSKVIAICICLLQFIPLLFFNTVSQVKRWHDRGRSGKMVFINLIPVVGWLWTLIELGFIQGTGGPNRYGEDSSKKTGNDEPQNEWKKISLDKLLFSLSGRISRIMYHTIWFCLCILSLHFWAFLIELQFFDENLTPLITFILSVFLLIPFLWISIVSQVKRWHDLGKPGWFVLLNFIPGYRVWAEVKLGYYPGEPGSNKYGADPLSPTKHNGLQKSIENENLDKLLFSFSGRISRLYYWIIFSGTVLFGLCLYKLSPISNYFSSYEDCEYLNEYLAFSMHILFVYTLIPPFIAINIAAQVKRWHDHGRSGWMVLINLIPIFGLLWTIKELGFKKGHTDPNKYGEGHLQFAGRGVLGGHSKAL